MNLEEAKSDKNTSESDENRVDPVFEGKNQVCTI